MPTVPSKYVEKIQFFATHNEPWAENAVEIGTSSAEVAQLDALTIAARDAYNAQQEAINAARSATFALQLAVDAMATAGASIIMQIRAKAASDGDGVYSLASIPVPAKPSPIGPPGQPTRFAFELNQDGTLMLKWKCKNPAGSVGTTYQVWRRIGPDGELKYLGAVGAKKFTDETLPAGTSQVMYQIQGIRSTAVGPWAQSNVNFGGTNRPKTVVVKDAAPTLIAA